MKMVVLHGQMHQGSTYHITKQFIHHLSQNSTDIQEFFLPKDAPHACVGCFNCFTKGETNCPHADWIQPIAKAIEEADLIILESPCYVMGMTGQLKAVLDHFGYRWMPHRPHPAMFSKVGLVISTAAGAGTKKVTKAMKENLFFWGIPKIYRYGKNVNAMNWQGVNEKKKLKIEREVIKKSRSISKHIGHAKPGLKTKFMFQIMQMMQKGNDYNPVDKEHWENNGWLAKQKPWQITSSKKQR